ncbi:MAG: hypothetical protein ACK4J0_03455 [Candidatus Anstonellaceae archaeon]
MGSKTKILLDTARFLVSLGAAYLSYYSWQSIRANDPPTYPIVAGIITFIVLILLFRSFSKGEGSA